MPQATVITPRGPFAWSASFDMLKTWQPVRHFARPDGTALLAFGLDRSFEPAGAIVREDGPTLTVEIGGTRATAAALGQVARIAGPRCDGLSARRAARPGHRSRHARIPRPASGHLPVAV